MRKTGGRHELKYYINNADYLQLHSRLPCVASPDKNALSDSSYRVRSLYFDNYQDKALREKIDGVDEREKFRIRLYNNDTSYIRLEKKSKSEGLCFKQSAIITKAECERLLNGDFSSLKENGQPLCLELYVKMQYHNLRPKNIVDYKREAYVYPAGNVRITIDSDIRAGLNTDSFLDQDFTTIPIPDVCILEVKYDNFLPEVVRGMVALSSRSQKAFSKYAATRII